MGCLCLVLVLLCSTKCRFTSFAISWQRKGELVTFFCTLSLYLQTNMCLNCWIDKER